MSRALKCGAIRLLDSHAGIRGRAFGKHYRALNERFGPFDTYLREFASGVAALWAEWRTATKDLDRAHRQRETAKGRRPSEQAIARLQKRQGLNWESYQKAVRELEERAKQADVGQDLAGDLAKQGLMK